MDLEKDGYGILEQALSESECRAVIDDLEIALSDMPNGSIKTSRGAFLGGRNLLTWWGGCSAIAMHTTVKTFATRLLGKNAGLVRALYFDKPPGSGWSLPMHRDTAIAVAGHCVPIAPFSKPTMKAGTPHVEATSQVLSGMLTLRLHLDPMLQDNGPLVVVPRSHRGDFKKTSALQKTIHCNIGDLFVMRPLLLHGSLAASGDTRLHRRVIHLEFAPSHKLPGLYQWHHFLLISSNRY